MKTDKYIWGATPEEISNLIRKERITGPLETKTFDKFSVPFIGSGRDRCDRAAAEHAEKSGYTTIIIKDIALDCLGAIITYEFYIAGPKYREEERKSLRESLRKVNPLEEEFGKLPE